MRYLSFISILYIAWLPISYLLLLSFGSENPAIGREDGIAETTGAVFFLIASLLFFISFVLSIDKRKDLFCVEAKRGVYFLLLSLFFFLCFGEEISWGQRFFGWATPDAWAGINAQKETNIHNLWIFQAYNPDGSAKGFWGLMLNFNRLFSLFILSYCIIVPMLGNYSTFFGNFLRKAGLPIPPLLIGFLFALNYLAFRTSLGFVDGSEVGSFDELKEANYAIAFAGLGGYFLLGQDASRRHSPHH